jgi:large subunit ribosomal protein L17
MHRHGYKGRKFGRERDQRQALLKGLADSLIIHESVETTLPKAKELLPYAEKLITKAKKGDLHSRRLIIAKLQTVQSAHKLVDEIAPKLSKRVSGHLKISKTKARRGDNAQLAKVSFVDDLKTASVPVPAPAPKPAEPKKEVKKPSPVKKAPAKKPAAKKTEAKK